MTRRPARPHPGRAEAAARMYGKPLATADDPDSRARTLVLVENYAAAQHEAEPLYLLVAVEAIGGTEHLRAVLVPIEGRHRALGAFLPFLSPGVRTNPKHAITSLEDSAARERASREQRPGAIVSVKHLSTAPDGSAMTSADPAISLAFGYVKRGGSWYKARHARRDDDREEWVPDGPPLRTVDLYRVIQRHDHDYVWTPVIPIRSTRSNPKFYGPGGAKKETWKITSIAPVEGRAETYRIEVQRERSGFLSLTRYPDRSIRAGMADLLNHDPEVVWLNAEIDKYLRAHRSNPGPRLAAVDLRAMYDRLFSLARRRFQELDPDPPTLRIDPEARTTERSFAFFSFPEHVPVANRTPDQTEIVVAPELAENRGRAEGVIAHEIGHYVDWFYGGGTPEGRKRLRRVVRLETLPGSPEQLADVLGGALLGKPIHYTCDGGHVQTTDTSGCTLPIRPKSLG